MRDVESTRRAATAFGDPLPGHLAQGSAPASRGLADPNMWPLRPDNAIPLAAGDPVRPRRWLPYERTAYITAGAAHNSTPGLWRRWSRRYTTRP